MKLIWFFDESIFHSNLSKMVVSNFSVLASRSLQVEVYFFNKIFLC